MAEKNSFLDGKLSVIDGAVTQAIGDLGGSDTNRVTLYNTALAKNPVSESGKFYTEAPDTPDKKIAQYVLLFEHPFQVTTSREPAGSVLEKSDRRINLMYELLDALSQNDRT